MVCARKREHEHEHEHERGVAVAPCKDTRHAGLEDLAGAGLAYFEHTMASARWRSTMQHKNRNRHGSRSKGGIELAWPWQRSLWREQAGKRAGGFGRRHRHRRAGDGQVKVRRLQRKLFQAGHSQGGLVHVADDSSGSRSADRSEILLHISAVGGEGGRASPSMLMLMLMLMHMFRTCPLFLPRRRAICAA